ncbi:MAG: hypothetical protein H7X83_06840 [Verrucomicrobia bacterium]|nr:hypothetical protein [Deltaproteobacteria bacterium]
MADTIKFKVSSTVALFVRPGVSFDQKLAGLETASSLEPIDRVTLIFCLMKDADAVVKGAAGSVFADLPDDVIRLYAGSSEAHPSLLDALARVHHAKSGVAEALLGNEILSGPAREFLRGRMLSDPVLPVDPPSPDVDRHHEVQSPADDLDDLDGDGPDVATDVATDEDGEEPAAFDEDDEQFLSKYKIAMMMGMSEKIKMALTGDKEWRSILIKDSNKLVSGGVIRNPRITDGEILTILKVGVQNDEIIRLICANKEWIKNYMIRKALIVCPKTPLPNSLRYLATLNEKDIATFAKSKNISSVLSTQAKRLLLAKKR